jgi:hypothetical protein
VIEHQWPEIIFCEPPARSDRRLGGLANALNGKQCTAIAYNQDCLPVIQRH